MRMVKPIAQSPMIAPEITRPSEAANEGMNGDGNTIHSGELQVPLTASHSAGGQIKTGVASITWQPPQ